MAVAGAQDGGVSAANQAHHRPLQPAVTGSRTLPRSSKGAELTSVVAAPALPRPMSQISRIPHGADIMMNRLVATVSLALACIGAAHAQLPPGISGSWYNPAQSGHGLSLEILDESHVLGFWYVYDPAGNPIHLYLDGVIDGTTIESNAYLSRGMRFGSFDRRDHQFRPWGSVTIDFSNCDAATLRWRASGEAGAGYGSGAMPLARLSRIAGLPCAIPGVDEAAALPAGLYAGRWGRGSGGDTPFDLQVAVDRRGRLWAAAEWTAGPGFISAHLAPPSFIGAGAVRTGNQAQAEVTVRHATAFWHPGAEPQISVPVTFTFEAAGHLAATTRTAAAPRLVEDFTFTGPAQAPDPLFRGGYGITTLAGREFAASTRAQFVSLPLLVRFLEDGAICIDLVEQVCQYAGTVGEFDAGMAMFEFELTDPRLPNEPYRGKGWVREDTRQLILVGESGSRGLGLVANER